MEQCVALDASDLHMAPGLPAYLRVHGILEPQDEHGMLSSETTEAIAAILSGLLAGHIGGKITETVLTPVGKAFPADQFREKVLNVTPERWMSAGKKQVAVEQQAATRTQQGPALLAASSGPPSWPGAS